MLIILQQSELELLVYLIRSVYSLFELITLRYLSVSKPIEYHNTVTASQSKWPRILRYILPVLIFSTLFNLPKFFELRVKTDYQPRALTTTNHAYNVTNDVEVRTI